MRFKQGDAVRINELAPGGWEGLVGVVELADEQRGGYQVRVGGPYPHGVVHCWIKEVELDGVYPAPVLVPRDLAGAFDFEAGR